MELMKPYRCQHLIVEIAKMPSKDEHNFKFQLYTII